jgi:hypothetical protein
MDGRSVDIIGRGGRVMKDKFSVQLAQLTRHLAESGLRLIDGSAKVKAVAFVGGVRCDRDQSSADGKSYEADEPEEG